MKIVIDIKNTTIDLIVPFLMHMVRHIAKYKVLEYSYKKLF